MKSEFKSINWADLANGLIAAVVGAILGYLLEIVQSGGWATFEWQTIGITALTAAVLFLSKTFYTNSEGEFYKAETGYKP